MPILSVPAFALGGYWGVVVTLVLMAALAATLLWTRAREVSGSPEAATFAWAAVALTTPFLFNSFHGVSGDSRRAGGDGRARLARRIDGRLGHGAARPRHRRVAVG